MGYVYLAIAILAEVIATTALKAADGFRNPAPSLLVVVGYATAFYFLSLVLKSIPVGIAYAIWSGLGIVLITLIAALVYRQIPDGAAILGMALIIAGVAVISLFSHTAAH
jgi:small multidrug resistance pump